MSFGHRRLNFYSDKCQPSGHVFPRSTLYDIQVTNLIPPDWSRRLLNFLKIPELVGSVPATPESDGSSRIRVTMIRQVDVLGCIWDTNTKSGFIIIVRPEMPHEGVCSGNDLLAVARLALNSEVLAAGDVLDVPATRRFDGLPLLVLSAVAVEADDALAVSPGKVDDSLALFVGDYIARL